MKKVFTQLFITMFVLLLVFNNSYANNRKIFEGNQKSIKTKFYGRIDIINWSELSDTLLLLKHIPEDVDTSKHSERMLIKDAINFFYQFLKSYKIGNIKKKYIGFGVCQVGYGYVKDNIYRISVKNLKKLNNRDFGKLDLDNTEKKSVTVIPVKEIFKHINILEVKGIPKNLKSSDIKKDFKATNVFLECLADYIFDLGIIEGDVEAAYEKKHKSSGKSSSAGRSSSTSGNYDSHSNFEKQFIKITQSSIGCFDKNDAFPASVALNMGNLSVVKEMMDNNLCTAFYPKNTNIVQLLDKDTSTFANQKVEYIKVKVIEVNKKKYNHVDIILWISYLDLPDLVPYEHMKNYSPDIRKESRSSSSGNNAGNKRDEVSYFEKQISVERGGTQTYSVGCKNGSSGTVSLTNYGDSIGSICANGGKHVISVCKPKDQWSTKAAAQKVCQ